MTITVWWLSVHLVEAASCKELTICFCLGAKSTQWQSGAHEGSEGRLSMIPASFPVICEELASQCALVKLLLV